MKPLSIILGLTLANFGWQALTDREWVRAAERSYFQAFAVFVCAIHLKPKPTHET